MPVITLAILAGGLGVRMGRPKSHLTVAGRPILWHLLDRLDWAGRTLLVTAPGVERPPGFERFTAEVVDAVPGEGPLRGMLTALEAAAGESIVVATVDMPNVGGRQLDWLGERLAGLGHAAAAVAARRPGGEVEPFPCALGPGAAGVIRELLAGGRRSVRGFFDDPRTAVVDAPTDWPGGTWVNLNRPEDLDAFGDGGFTPA